MTDTDPLLISVKDAARILGGLSAWQVYQLMDSEQLASCYVGRRRFTTPEALRAYRDSLPTEREPEPA